MVDADAGTPIPVGSEGVQWARNNPDQGSAELPADGGAGAYCLGIAPASLCIQSFMPS